MTIHSVNNLCERYLLQSSIEVKSYEIKLKRKYLEKFKLFVRREKEVWRLTLRANVHYNYKIKLQYFNTWLTFINEKKELTLKYKKANEHNQFKLKTKYFYYLAFYPLIKELDGIHQQILVNYIYYLFLNYNVLKLHLDLLTCRRNYLLLFHSKNKRCSETLRICLKILYNNAVFKRWKREINHKCRMFFIAKNPGYLRSYFVIWKTFVEDSVRQKYQMVVAEEFYNNKILRKCTKNLKTYTIQQQIERFQTALAITFCTNKLKIKYLRSLLTHSRKRSLKRKKLKLAKEHFIAKFMLKYLRIMQQYAKDNQQYRMALITFNRKSARRCLQQLRRYTVYKKVMNAKKNLAIKSYEIKLKATFFNCLIEHWQHNKELERRSHILLRKTLLIKSYEAWTHFVLINKANRLKSTQSRNHFETKLRNNCFEKWRKSIHEKRLLIANLERVLIRWMFRKWKTFYLENLSYKKKKLVAWNMYNVNIIKKSLRVIVGAGLVRQASKELFIIQSAERQLKIAAKYFRIWKSNVLNTYSSTVGVLIQNNFEFQWDPICFEEPRIPSFLNTIKY